MVHPRPTHRRGGARPQAGPGSRSVGWLAAHAVEQPGPGGGPLGTSLRSMSATEMRGSAVSGPFPKVWKAAMGILGGEEAQ